MDTMPTIQAILYGNPDRYPPIINSTRVLANRGYQVTILCRDTGETPAYPRALVS